MWKKIGCFLMLLVFLTTSCQKKEEKRLDTLNLNFQEGDLPSLHPHSLMIYLRGISLGKSLYEGLTRIDAQGKPQLAGAEDIDITGDGLQYIFHIRENKWSDGTPVTAMDYENAWKRALSPESNCPRADLLYMIKNAEQAKKGLVSLDAVGVKAIHDDILMVDLAYPSPYFLELVAQPLCAPLADATEKNPTKFNGPFLVDEWKHGDYLKLKKNPHYWDQEQIALQQVNIYMVQDTMTAFSLYEKGQVDWIGLPFVPLSPEMINNLQKKNVLEFHPVKRAFWVFLNTQHPALSSPSIRQALSLAIDRKAITDHIFSAGQPLNKPLPESLLPVPPVIPIEENLVQAQEQFEAGLEELELTAATFPSLVITYSQQAGRKQLAEYLQQTWSKAFKINVQAEPQEWNILRANLGEGNFQISGSFEAAFYNDPLELMEKFVTVSPNNFPKWINSEFIEVVAHAKEELDPQKRLALLGDAEQILTEEMPFIPISSDEFIFSHYPSLTGYVFDCVGACDFSRVSLK